MCSHRHVNIVLVNLTPVSASRRCKHVPYHIFEAYLSMRRTPSTSPVVSFRFEISFYLNVFLKLFIGQQVNRGVYS